MFLSQWRVFFPLVSCLAKKKKNLTARVSLLLKPRAPLTFFRVCLLSGRAKDLAACRYFHLWPF